MWVLIYDARDYAKGAAIATLLLVGISILIIPYLVYTVRSERARHEHDDGRTPAATPPRGRAAAAGAPARGG